MPQSRHRYHYRWYNPMPQDEYDEHTCGQCGLQLAARWYKETRDSVPLLSMWQDVVWPTEPEDAPQLLCDSCYRRYCGGVTSVNARRTWDEGRYGMPVINGLRINNHIKRRLP